MPRDQIIWKPCKMDTEAFGVRTVYVKHYLCPYVGTLPAINDAFTVPAYIIKQGKRIKGFITPRDGMAFQQEHESAWFVAYKAQSNTSEA